MGRPKRSDQKDLENEILVAAWSQIASQGAAALSLRAIARSLEITAPAIYNYYPNRDALVTQLIVEAYRSLGDWLANAAQSPSDGPAERLRALGLAYRNWAVTYPERYQLIFGTPIAGYRAPPEVTTPVARRTLSPLVATFAEANATGQLQGAQVPPVRKNLSTIIQDRLSAEVPDLPPEVLYRAVAIWSRVHGLVSLEIGGQYPTFITQPDEIFEHELEKMIAENFSPDQKNLSPPKQIE